MGIIITYMIKSGICLFLFYLLYKWLLAGETFFRLNRAYLIGVWPTALILTSIPIPKLTNIEKESTQHPYTDKQFTVDNYNIELSSTNPTELFNTIAGILYIIYFTGAAIMAARLIITYWQLFRITNKGIREKLSPGKYIIINKTCPVPFNWLNYIIIPNKELLKSHPEIIVHEKAHLDKRHSFDLLLADFCLILQWFNPSAWLLKKEMQAVHEYEADQTVLSSGFNARSYQLLLIEKAAGTSRYTLASSLNHSSLKKRITMMLKEKSSPWARAKYLCILPLAALSVMALANPTANKVSNDLSMVKVTDLWSSGQTNHSKNKPLFPGGEKAFNQFIADNLKYPPTTAEGRVTCEVTIGTDGKVSDVRITMSADSVLNAEVIRVMKSMPAWQPAMQDGKAVQSTVSFSTLFRLEDKDQQTNPDSELTITKDIVVTGNRNIQKQKKTESDYNKFLDKALCIIDGKVTTAEEVRKLSDSDIDYCDMMLSKAAVKKFGEKAKHGVIIVHTKKK